MQDRNEIVGVIYSLRKNNFDILQKRENPIYVKFIAHTTSKNPTRLNKGHFLLLYLSRRNNSISGYAKINKVSFKTPSDIKQNYIERIQMKKEEFDRYIIGRESKPLLFLELKEIVKIKKNITINHRMTMAGKYITNNEMKLLLGDNFID